MCSRDFKVPAERPYFILHVYKCLCVPLTKKQMLYLKKATMLSVLFQ